MAGKVQTDHAGMCAAYRTGLSQADVAEQFGTTKATVVRAVSRGIPLDERRSLRLARLASGAKKSSAIRQGQKIARGDFVIQRHGEVLKVFAGGREFTFDPCDEDLLRKFAWRVTPDARLIRGIGTKDRRNIYVYHDILEVVPSRELVVDHINRDQTDNRRINLRICTFSENSRNRGPRVVHVSPPSTGKEREHAR